MSMFRLQELLNKQNLSLQELSDRSGLPIETIETIEPKVQEVLTNLEKIAQSLNTTVPKLLEPFSIPKDSDRPEGPFFDPPPGNGETPQTISTAIEPCQPGSKLDHCQ